MMNKELVNLERFFRDDERGKTAEKIIRAGDYVAVFGRSGSGKTTLLNELNEDLRKKGIRTGYLLQNIDAQIVTDKVWHELSFSLENLGTPSEVMKLRVAEMTNYFGLQDWFEKDISSLSGGQKQLLNLASVMASAPDVILLDEPTSQLDPVSALNFLNTVKKINLELGTTVILVEQRLEEVFSAGDKCIFMQDGKISAFDSPQNVGNRLFSEKSEMILSLPSPMRIFYGIAADFSQSSKCPLSVRDGRNWLESLGAFLPAPTRSTDFASKEKHAPACPPFAIQLKNVFFRYEKKGRDVLKDATVSVPEKSVFAVVGGNGSGKSTLLKVMCGVRKPYAGKIHTTGFAAMLSQEPKNIFTKSTVREELEECSSDRAQLEEVISVCELSAILNLHPFDISGGEVQRLAIAKLLLKNPKILLLDEPTKGMDNAYKTRFAAFLKTLAARGVTIIIVSHDLEFCSIAADFVGMFFDGQLSSVLPPRQFFARNNFYTTSANRMCRRYFPEEITAEGVIEAIRSLANKKAGATEAAK